MNRIRNEFSGQAFVDGELARIPLTGTNYTTEPLTQIDLRVRVGKPNISESDKNVLSKALLEISMNKGNKIKSSPPPDAVLS